MWYFCDATLQALCKLIILASKLNRIKAKTKHKHFIVVGKHQQTAEIFQICPKVIYVIVKVYLTVIMHLGEM